MSPPITRPRLVSVKAAAEHYQVSPQTVLRWVKKGWIRSVRLPSGTYRIPADALDDLDGGTIAPRPRD